MLKRVGLAFLVAASAGLPSSGHLQAAVDTTGRAGDITFVDVNRPGIAVVNGDTDTEFRLQPPDGAECPGDTRNDGWFVSSFLVPMSTKIYGLKWGQVFPLGDGNRAMRTNLGSLYGADVTVANDAPGSPGTIKEGPIVTFGMWPEGFEVPPGRYRVGIACTFAGVAERYWATEVVVSDSVAGGPTDIQWLIAGSTPPAPADSGFQSGSLAALAIFVFAALALVAYLRRRSKQHVSNGGI